MPDSKITALTSILTSTDPANDPLVIVDVSDTSMAATGTTKKVTLNQLLGASGTATLASATITGDLTVDTSTLKVDSANNRVGIGTASPHEILTVANTGGNVIQSILTSATGTGNIFFATSTTGVNSYRGYLQYDQSLNSLAFGINSTLAMTLNSTGLGVGGSPVRKFTAYDTSSAYQLRLGFNTSFYYDIGRSSSDGLFDFYGAQSGATGYRFGGVDGTRMTIDTSGNVGIGVTPSAYGTGIKGLDLGAWTSVAQIGAASFYGFNSYASTTGQFNYKNNGAIALGYFQTTSGHLWLNAPSNAGAAGANATFTTAMTLDTSGNLLVGTTTGSRNCIYKSVAVGSIILDVQSPSTATVSTLTYAADASGASAANTVFLVQKVTATSRSINAAGTVNASGADYAEYMTKAGDFVLSKGDIAGIDTNGKLTNVFADAVSFVVKSTDPSYVGNDKWGIGLEGDALEAARQLVDRIAFAGQVPVNVTGAKAGDYIVPVVDGAGIKGIAVSNPTFEQYQLAVGKVIAIDADGRARIIVKVA